MNGLAHKLGYRNVLRNKRRTIITTSVIGIGLACILLAQGFVDGFLNYMVHLSTSDFSGAVKIHHESYLTNSDKESIIPDYQQLAKKLEQHDNIQAVAPRIISEAMIASPENNYNVFLFGVDPRKEALVSRLKEKLVSGNFLAEDSHKLPNVYMSTRLAEKLKVEIGQKIVITSTTNFKSEIVQDLFIIQGLFDFENKFFDMSHIFINIEKAAQFLQVSNQSHELILKLKSPNIQNSTIKEIHDSLKLSNPQLTVRGWQEFLPALLATVKMSKQSISYILIFMGFLIMLTVTNTLYMSLFERIHEFGIIQSIGTHKNLLRQMISWEAFYLGFWGVIFGLTLTLIFGSYLSIVGVDYRGLSHNGVSIRDPIYFLFSIRDIVTYSFITIIFVVIISFYPAEKILKIDPAQAIRMET